VRVMQFNFNGRKVNIVDTNGSVVANEQGDTTVASGSGTLKEISL